MATVTGGSIALNMLEANFAFTHADSLITDSDGATFITVQTPNGRTQRLNGMYSFDIFGNLLGAQITSIEEYSGGNLIYRVSGFYLDHLTWGNFVLTNNAPAQRNFIFFGNDTITGSQFSDTLAGWTGDDVIIGGGGNDTIYGGVGTDTAVFSGNRADYQIVKANGRITITDTRGIDGVDTLYDVERFNFADIQGVVANHAPVVTASNLAPAHGTQSIAAAGLFTVTDADAGDTLTYQIFDSVGHGRLRLNGVDLPEFTTITLSASDLANLEFRTSSTGSDSISVRANDGLGWTAWRPFTVAAVPNAAPTLSVSNKTPGKADTFIAGADLATAADGDGDTLTYRFYDGTSGNGRFTLNGNPVTERANFDVAAADLANLRFELSTTGAGDTLWVQVHDGYEWTAWKTFTVAAPANVAPVVNVQNLSPAKGTTTIAGADLFTVTDPDDASMVRYRFYDGTIGNGRFYLNGDAQAERQNFEFDAADLANLEYRTSAGGGDTLWVQAYDGYAWSDWKSFTVAAPANIAPTVNVSNLTPAHGVTAIAAANLFTLTDPDDANTALAYRFYDGTLGNGRFWLNGAAQIEQRNIEITQAQLADLEYRTSPTGTGDMLWIQAFDGIAWSAWKSFTVAAPVNTAPVVNVQPLAPAHGVARIAGDHLYTSITDADGDPITRYRFYDGTLGNGRYYLSGTAQVEQRNIEITAAELADFEYRTSATGSDVLWVQVFDGTTWSAWKSYTVAAVPNAAPVVTVQNLVPTAGQTAIAGADLFDVGDADGDPITRYRFYDGTIGNGRFWLNGDAQIEQRNIEIAAADLANFEYRTSTGGGDTLWVQAYDGYAWSDWKSYTVAAAPTSAPPSGGGVVVALVGITSIDSPEGGFKIVDTDAPVVSTTDAAIAAGTATFVSPLLSASDPTGDAVVSWQLWDATTGSGAFRVNGAVQPEHAAIEVMANQLAAVEFLGGNSAGDDRLWARASDGTGWGEWKPFTITTLAPV